MQPFRLTALFLACTHALFPLNIQRTLPSIIPSPVPKITVVCVIDQFAHASWDKTKPFLRGGIAQMAKTGHLYEQAYYPHARPATGTGHTALNTGAFAKDHGIVANTWQDMEDRFVQCDNDFDLEKSAVFSPKGVYEYGRSAEKILVPGLSEVAKDNNCAVISLSHKSRSAICMAGKGGFAAWFDDASGGYTTSKAYSKAMPLWMKAFNRRLGQLFHKVDALRWKCVYPENHPAYNFSFVDDYRYAHPPSLVNRAIDLPKDLKKRSKIFQQTPAGCSSLFLLALYAARRHYKHNPDQPLVLWISLSSLDILGHFYGPDSRECIDIIYQIDMQLKRFMHDIEQTFGPSECAWALTSDHGIMSIPELLKHKNIHGATRISAEKMITSLNRAFYRRFNVKNLITHFDIPYFYFDEPKWNALSTEEQVLLLEDGKELLQAYPGIVRAWSCHDLKNGNFARSYGPHARETWFQKQYFEKRCGQLACMVAPYSYLTTYDKGTSHCTPYDYDVRVPLMLRAPGRILPGITPERVSMLKLPTTLARMLKLPIPAYAPARTLPDVFEEKLLS